MRGRVAVDSERRRGSRARRRRRSPRWRCATWRWRRTGGGRRAAAQLLQEEALASARQAGDARERALAWRGSGLLAMRTGQVEPARRLLAESLTLRREVGDATRPRLGAPGAGRHSPWRSATTLRAQALLDESLRHLRGDRQPARAREAPGAARRPRPAGGDLTTAERRYRQGLAVARAGGALSRSLTVCVGAPASRRRCGPVRTGRAPVRGGDAWRSATRGRSVTNFLPPRNVRPRPGGADPRRAR